MNTPLIRPTLLGLVLALAVTALSSFVAQAHPYASGITNTGGTISFILNETADTVGVYFPDNNSTNFLGANLTKGVHSFTLGPGTNHYVITAAKVGSGSVSQISVDTNRFLNFWGPRGVAVNRSPKTGNFGRIYVVNASPGTQPLGGLYATNGTRVVTRGIYAANADGTDAVGQGDTAKTCGMSFATSTTYSPFRCSVGPDDMLYVGDACGYYVGGTISRTNGVYMVQPNLSSGVNLFPIDGSVPEVCGGVEGQAVVGSYAAGTLGVYVCSWDLNDTGSPTSYGYQTIWLYTNFTTLPFTGTPSVVGYAGNGSIMGVSANMTIGPDGKVFGCEPRGTPAAGNAPIHVFGTDGTLLWNSWDNWVPAGGDPYTSCRGITISSDGTMMVCSVGNTGNFSITQLTNGIPDPGTYTLVSTGFGGTSYGVEMDAANNVYITSSGLALCRIYSLGFTTAAITSNDATTTNGTFQLITPGTTVSVTATVPVTSEDTTQPPGQFNISRGGSTSTALRVPFTLTGTATNGVQYTNLTLSAIIPAGQSSVNVFVKAIPSPIAGPTRTVIMSLLGGSSYSVVAPSSATVYIVDTNHPAVHVAVHDAQFYERTNDYARFTLTRWGDTNAALSQVNVTYGGTASQTSPPQFYGWASTNFNPGDITQNVYVFPIHDGLVTGPLTVTATVGAANDGSYDVGAPATSGAVTRVDADDPPETVLWSDNLQTDTSANWTQLYAAAPDPTVDDTVTWAYDYTAVLAPPAPHSGADTHGLYMTVNKGDAIAASAALNFYPNGQSFSGNYALRFDMFLIENDTVSTTEYNLFGINHSGTMTNWYRNSTTTFNGVGATGWNFDGLFYSVESDGAGLGDYVGYSSPTTAGNNPTPITAGVNASTLTGIFKAPPWTPGASGGGAAANVYGSVTPIWADVELKQVNGVIYWSINHTLIFAYTNTTAYKSGNIMLGYEDGYDSIGSSGGAVIYANARVISLARPHITSIVDPVAGMTIVFQANAGDVPAQFTLQKSSPLAAGPYADVASTITSLGGGAFQAVKAKDASPAFYRIRRIE
jgi:hypothetical protein